MPNSQPVVDAARELQGHPRGDDLARLVHTLSFTAVDERRSRLGDGLMEVAERLGLDRDAAKMSHGNLLDILESSQTAQAGAESSAARVVLSAALSHGVALSPPIDDEAADGVAAALVWLAGNTPADGFVALDVALGLDAARIWKATGRFAQKAIRGEVPNAGRSSALVAISALAMSSTEAAAIARATLQDVDDPMLGSALASGTVSGDASSALAPLASASGGSSDEGDDDADNDGEGAEGELVGAPRNPVLLAALALSGLLFIIGFWRLISRSILRLRRKAQLQISKDGITVVSRTQLLGRVLREQRQHIPRDGIMRATREVRYPRLSFYIGLGALVLGSYLGIRFFIDGARSGSPELLGIGIAFVLVGLVLDYALSHWSAAAKGQCRLLIVPRRGPTLAVGELDPIKADAQLRKLVP